MIAECQGGGGDLLIKLFGRTIPVPESGDAKDLQQSSSNSSISTEQDQAAHADAQENAHQDTSDPSPQPEVVDAEDPAKSSPDQQTHHSNGNGGDAASQREKLRKPDKVLPCPRCNSMDTKFCYFNNYNVNQPRHFCKNCQRYWTAGGAMRNVPVGAGRRKNKNAVAAAAAAASHFLHRVRACGAGGDALKTTTNGTVLSFGGHGGGAPPPGPGPACLDLAEQLEHLQAPVRNAAGKPGPACSQGSSNRDANNDDMSSSVDEAAAANGDGSVSVQQQQQQQHPAAASMNNVWPPPPPPYSCAPSPAAAYFSSGIAIPMIYPAAAPGYWGACMVPGAWSLPWPPVQQPPSSSSLPTTAGAPSVSSSGTADPHTLGLGLGLGLGKHPRDREDDDNGRNAGNAKVWAPKTIRIDDVDEVARSSIWSLIGIKAGDKNSKQQQDKQQLGTVFEPKHEATKSKKQAMVTSSPLLHANPVALTRSVAFQEGSA